MYFIDSFGCLCYGNRTKYSKGDSRENGNPTVMRKNTTPPTSFPQRLSWEKNYKKFGRANTELKREYITPSCDKPVPFF